MGARRIGEVALKTGLSVDAIRFYEKTGLVPKPARTRGGYRLYRDSDIADLKFIQKAQLLVFSLNEIREEWHPLRKLGAARYRTDTDQRPGARQKD